MDRQRNKILLQQIQQPNAEKKSENQSHNCMEEHCKRNDMNSEGKYNILPSQVENKFKALKKCYIKILKQENKLGRGYKQISFQK